MVTSSAISARWGSSTEISAPDLPCRANLCGEPSIFGTPLMKANRSPLRTESGQGLPLSSTSLGLLSNKSRWLGAPAMNK